MPNEPASPLDFPESPLTRIMSQPFLLGLFLPIQSGGWSPSSLPRSTSWDFDYNARLTQRAEELGFDLAFGLAQWIGKGGTGGAIRFREQSLDPFITATSLAAITKRIILISTIHVLYGSWHPLYLAKFAATVDHISGGRWGLNVVTLFVFGMWTTDSQSGLRGFSRAALEKIDIRMDRMEVSSEFIKEIRRCRLPYSEVPIRAIYSDYSLGKGQRNLNGFNILIRLVLHRLMED